MEKYSTQYFIDKFDKIPEELWIVGDFFLSYDPKCRCALGHCGVYMDDFKLYSTDEGNELKKIFHPRTVVSINDDTLEIISKGSTPKQRILNFLKGLQDETN